MKKNWYGHLVALGLCCFSTAKFSVRVNLGMTTVGHQTKALLMQNFDELAAFQTLENFRGTNFDDYVKVSTKHAYPAPLGLIFVQEDNASQPWSGTTEKVYLTPITVSADDSNITFTDETLLTGTDSTSGDQTDDFSGSSGLTIIVQNGMKFESTSLTPYTTSATSSGYFDLQAYVVSESNFKKIKQLRDDLLETSQLKANHLYAQKHYNTLDAGINLSYDFDSISLVTIVTGRYPMDLSPRETIPLISFVPGGTIDASFGAMIGYGKGQIGAMVGMTKINGSFHLSKYLRADSSSLQYIDYNNSYNNGQDSVILENVSDKAFYVELRAEGMPSHEGGTTFYGSYKVGFGRAADEDGLANIDLRQDSLAIGGSLLLLNSNE